MSVVTPILTGRLNLNRNTSNLLDLTAIAAGLSVDRQALQTIRVSVEIIGNTVSGNPGLVTIYTDSGVIFPDYVVQDRVTAALYAITIEDGVVSLVPTIDPAQTDPIVEDSLVPGNHWKIVVDDGVIGVESIVSSNNDLVQITDITTATNYKIIVSDGAIGITPVITISETFQFFDNDIQTGHIDFVRIDGITTSGILDGFLIVKAINRMGQPINQQINIASGVPVRFYRKKNRLVMQKAGQEQIGDYKMMTEPDLDIQEADIIYPTLGLPGVTMGQILDTDYIFDFQGLTHHIEAEFQDV